MTRFPESSGSVPSDDSEGADEPRGSLPRKVRTYFHPMVCSLIQSALPAQWEAIPEHLLHHEPQRVDILVIQRKQHGGDEGLPEVLLPSLLSRLGTRATLLEFKGPSDRLQAEDASTVLGYAMQFVVQKKFQVDEVAVGVLASQLSQGFLEQLRVHGGALTQTEPGLWDGHASGFRVFVLELSRVWSRGEAEQLWYVLTPAFGRDRAPMQRLSNTQRMVYLKMYEQFRREHPSGGEDMQQYEEFMDQMLEKYLASKSTEKLMSRFKPEERLSGLRPEERLSGLRPEERLSGLRPEERFIGLSPEERLSGLRPEELTVVLQALQAQLGRPDHEAP